MQAGDEDDGGEAPAARGPGRTLVALELLLLSLGRAQAQVTAQNDDARKILETLRREWSEAYRVQLTA